MKTALIKLAKLILTHSEKARSGVIIAVLSVVTGFLGLMLLPVAVLSGMGGIDSPETKFKFVESDFISSLDPYKQDKLQLMEADGQEIAAALSERGLHEQIIKAQLIYFSFFEDDRITDIAAYAELFRLDDNAVLLENINESYGKSIVYDDFMRTYTMIMNRTMNEYMFTSPDTKNAADLAAWVRNAYIAGWGFKDGSYGEIDEELHYRCADNLGLIMGYMRYSPDTKLFDKEFNELIFDEIGCIDTMPDVQGLGVYNGSEFGIYAGSGEVISSSAIGGCVQKSDISEWSSWCTFEDVEYPDEVRMAIELIRNPPETTTNDKEKK